MTSTIRLRLGARDESTMAVRVAGAVVCADRPLAELEPFRAVATPAGARKPPPEARSHATWSTRTEAQLGSDLVALAVCHDAAGYVVDLGAEVRMRVAPDGGSIALELPRGGAVHEARVVECVLGPGLLLALALGGTFALHASAALHRGAAAAFLGPSGAGKSTLAADLDRRRAAGWRRLADDVLPVAPGPRGELVAWPEFPQLKRGPEEQYVARGARPERVPLAALYILTPLDEGIASPIEDRAVRVETVAARDAVAAIAAHSIATRLFAPDLAARHFAFCATAAERTAVKRLIYPRRVDALEAVAAALEHDLAT